MNTNQARRTLKLTSILLAGAAGTGCSSPPSSDCTQTATCSTMPSADGGPGSASPMGDAVAIKPANDAGASTGCQTDGDCALGTICSSNKCVTGCTDKHGCQADEACCDGQCFDTKTDVKHCGGCSACAVSNGAAGCSDGTCNVASCSPGFVDCDGKVDNGCELAKPVGPTVPTPTRPVTGDYTGSFRADSAVNALRPTFKWIQSTPDTCGAVTYQIQLDDSCKAGDIQACAFSTPEVDATVTTNSFQPATALAVQKTQPVGTRYYWRVRACDGAKVCSSWSTVRYVEVGRVRDDLNGDGYSDLLVQGGADNLYVYFGGSSPSSQAAVHGKPGSSFAFGGDLDADGFADLLVGDASVSKGAGSNGAVLVYLGKATWGAELGQHETIYHTADATTGFPTQVAAAGDFDGDGHADILTSFVGDTSITVFLDVAGRFSTPTFMKAYNDPPPIDVGRAGDVDGDGMSDVAVLQEAGSTGRSIVAFFRGAANPSEQAAVHQTLEGVTLSTLRAAGDLDGDGFDDIALAGVGGSISASTLITLRGQPSLATRGGLFSQRRFPDDSVAFRGLAGGWDTNGDGRSDLYWTAAEGYALLSIPGAPNFTGQSPAVTIDASSTGYFYGTALAMGDYDGDGFADLAVASTRWDVTESPAEAGTVSIRLAKGTVIHLSAPSTVGFGVALGH